MNFEVTLTRRAEKNLKELSKRDRSAVREALLEMEVDPFAGDYKKLQGDEGHRRRVGRYRILYDIDTTVKLVTVAGIKHGSEAYR